MKRDGPIILLLSSEQGPGVPLPSPPLMFLIPPTAVLGTGTQDFAQNLSPLGEPLAHQNQVRFVPGAGDA